MSLFASDRVPSSLTFGALALAYAVREAEPGAARVIEVTDEAREIVD